MEKCEKSFKRSSTGVNDIALGDVVGRAPILEVFGLDYADARWNLVRESLCRAAALYEEIGAVGVDAPHKHPKSVD